MGNICRCLSAETAPRMQFRQLLEEEEDLADDTPPTVQYVRVSPERPRRARQHMEEAQVLIPIEEPPEEAAAPPPAAVSADPFTVGEIMRATDNLMDEDEAQDELDYVMINMQFSPTLALYKTLAFARKRYRESGAAQTPASAREQIMFDIVRKGLENKMPPDVAWAIVAYAQEQGGELPDWTIPAQQLYKRKTPALYINRRASVAPPPRSARSLSRKRKTNYPASASSQGATGGGDEDRVSPLPDFSHFPRGRGRHPRESNVALSSYYMDKARRRREEF